MSAKSTADSFITFTTKTIPDTGRNIYHAWPWLLGIVLAGIVMLYVGKLLAGLFNWRRLLKRSTVFLELTPPAHEGRSPLATQQLFNVIHAQWSHRSFLDKLVRRPIVVVPEITSSREAGIRYIIQADRQLVAHLRHAVTAYLPDVKIAEVEDYLLKPGTHTVVTEFKQTGHYAFPLASHTSLEEHDPVAYLVGAMSRLEPGELISFQFILTPINIGEAKTLGHRIRNNEDVITRLQQKRSLLGGHLKDLVSSSAGSALDLAGEVFNPPTIYGYSASQRAAQDQLQTYKRLKPARQVSNLEQERLGLMHVKVSESLFRVNLRVMVSTNSKEATQQRLGMIESSLGVYDDVGHQSLTPKIKLPLVSRKYRQFVHDRRLPALLPGQSAVLSASELASLYHFPLGNTSQTDNLMTSHSKTLPAPVSLKNGSQLDVLLGQNVHHSTVTNVGLTAAEREHHIYLIGGTGNGKTTMLQYAIVQDMQCGKGVAIVDPHGDMAETLLRHVPEDRLKDVIYFNPDDLDYPIGLNLLEMTPGLSGNALLREKDLITESVVSVFRKIFSEEDSGGHRIEYVLRNAIHTALTVEGATLFTVLKLLQNATYRRKITAKLKDEDLIDFWKSELGQAGNMQRVKLSVGITSKIGRFNSNAAARLILGQQKSTIDFEDMINSGKILICNFSKGLLGEDVAELFGITILAKLQLASLRRARIQQTDRRPFYLYVDEFQNFATASFVQMLSESRKYKLFMTMAEQSTSQQKDQQMVNIILANVGTIICFRTGNPVDERLMLPFFSPYIEAGEIANLSAFNFYARLSSLKAQEPLSGQTVLLDDAGSQFIAKQVVDESRATYSQIVTPVAPEEIAPPPKETQAKDTSTNKTTKVKRKTAQDKEPEKEDVHNEGFPEET